MWTSDYGGQKTGGKKYKRNKKKSLNQIFLYGMISNCDILFNSLFPANPGARDHKEVQDMNKYELAVVVNAKLEDDARAEVIEKVKALIVRFGGNVTDVDEWGKRRLAYEIQKMKEAYYYFIHFESDAETPGEIEQRVRIMDNVIRYLCVRQEA